MKITRNVTFEGPSTSKEDEPCRQQIARQNPSRNKPSNMENLSSMREGRFSLHQCRAGRRHCRLLGDGAVYRAQQTQQPAPTTPPTQTPPTPASPTPATPAPTQPTEQPRAPTTPPTQTPPTAASPAQAPPAPAQPTQQPQAPASPASPTQAPPAPATDPVSSSSQPAKPIPEG